MSDTTSAASGAKAQDQPFSGSSDRSRSAVPAEPRLRLWPGIAIVALLWIAIKVAAWVATGTMIQFQAMFMGPMVATAAFVAWWLFASRLPWRDRWLGVAAFVA